MGVCTYVYIVNDDSNIMIDNKLEIRYVSRRDDVYTISVYNLLCHPGYDLVIKLAITLYFKDKGLKVDTIEFGTTDTRAKGFYKDTYKVTVV